MTSTITYTEQETKAREIFPKDETLKELVSAKQNSEQEELLGSQSDCLHLKIQQGAGSAMGNDYIAGGPSGGLW